jgi:hypothetical protein
MRLWGISLPATMRSQAKFALNVPHLPQFINIVLAWQPGVAELVPSRSGEQLHRHTR